MSALALPTEIPSVCCCALAHVPPVPAPRVRRSYDVPCAHVRHLSMWVKLPACPTSRPSWIPLTGAGGPPPRARVRLPCASPGPTPTSCPCPSKYRWLGGLPLPPLAPSAAAAPRRPTPPGCGPRVGGGAARCRCPLGVCIGARSPSGGGWGVIPRGAPLPVRPTARCAATLPAVRQGGRSPPPPGGACRGPAAVPLRASPLPLALRRPSRSTAQRGLSPSSAPPARSPRRRLYAVRPPGHCCFLEHPCPSPPSAEVHGLAPACPAPAPPCRRPARPPSPLTRPAACPLAPAGRPPRRSTPSALAVLSLLRCRRRARRESRSVAPPTRQHLAPKSTACSPHAASMRLATVRDVSNDHASTLSSPVKKGVELGLPCVRSVAGTPSTRASQAARSAS
eukprot:5864984-Pleurochrysis_carterae.AAC.1